jgi:hypothetical protein
MLLKKHMQGTSRQQTYRKDVLSHHILRLAYCRTADLRNWLLAQEALLFKYRFKVLGRPQQVRLQGPFQHHLLQLLLCKSDSMQQHHLAGFVHTFCLDCAWTEITRACLFSSEHSRSEASSAAGRSFRWHDLCIVLCWTSYSRACACAGHMHVKSR